MATKFYPGKLTVFTVSETKNIRSVWQKLVRDLETHSAAGDHIYLTQWPHVQSLAADISVCLTKASEVAATSACSASG